MSCPPQTRRLRLRALLVSVPAILLILTGLVLYVPRVLPDRVRAHRDAGQFALETRDANGQWDWRWTDDMPCLQGLASWAVPHGVQLLVLELAEPAEHDLPIRSLYPDTAASPEMAGAWCETRASGRFHTLACTLAPFTNGDPSPITTALTGALGQAMAYALNPSVFAETRNQAWTWTQWQPLVEPNEQAGGWQSVCPALIPADRRMP